MKLIRYAQPLENLLPTVRNVRTFTEDLDRWFDDQLSGFGFADSLLSRDTFPALDLYQDEDQVTVRLELPGVKKEDVQISFHEGVLTVSGERKHEKPAEDSQVRLHERFYGEFNRSVRLPLSVNSDAAKAEYLNGVLTITLPKHEEAKPKQITISE